MVVGNKLEVVLLRTIDLLVVLQIVPVEALFKMLAQDACLPRVEYLS